MGCQSSTQAAETNDNNNTTINVNVSENRTIALKCDQDRICVKYSCGGEYLESSTQLAVFTVKSVINFKLLGTVGFFLNNLMLTFSEFAGLKHKERLSSEDLIAYVPVAYQTSSTGRYF